MKIILLILSMSIGTTSYGQLNKLIGTWISNASDVIVITDTTNKYDNSNMLCTSQEDEGLAVFLLRDTLSFQKRYYSSSTDYKKLYIDRYDMIIMEATDSTLVLEPSSKLSMKFFNDRKNIKFTKQEYNIDNTIAFQKIIYHTTQCYGSCPTIDLEIDNGRNIYLSAEFYKGDFGQVDSNRSGQYTGKLSDSLYGVLINILQTCNLRTISFRPAYCCDGAITTLIVYFNGQRKYLKSMFPPHLAYKLIEFLYAVDKQVALNRTSEKRALEE